MEGALTRRRQSTAAVQSRVRLLSNDLYSTGLVGPISPLGRGVFSRASFAIQPRPRLRTLLEGAGPQAPGVSWQNRGIVVQLQPPTFVDFDEKTMSAQPGHPCDETAVAVLLGTPKLSPPPCFLALEMSAPTAP